VQAPAPKQIGAGEAWCRRREIGAGQTKEIGAGRDLVQECKQF